MLSLCEMKKKRKTLLHLKKNKKKVVVITVICISCIKCQSLHMFCSYKINILMYNMYMS